MDKLIFFQIRLTQKLKEELKAEAERQDRSMNWIACQALKEYTSKEYIKGYVEEFNCIEEPDYIEQLDYDGVQLFHQAWYDKMSKQSLEGQKQEAADGETEE